MKNAIIYLRVSTSGQVEDGVSLEAQEAKARAWCSLNDYHVKNVFTDAGISGKRTDNRPGLQNALDCVEDTDALIVYSFSRLGRSNRDVQDISEDLEAKGVDLVSLSEKIDTTGAAGKMVFRMLAVLSEFERDQVSERTRAALQHKKSKGERTGSIPYGFTLALDKINLIKDDTEQAAIALCKKLREQGLSQRKIAAELTKQGFKPRGGKNWHNQTIANILAANQG